jgi:hypothetical protein
MLGGVLYVTHRMLCKVVETLIIFLHFAGNLQPITNAREAAHDC